MRVQIARKADLNEWLLLAAGVEYLFGPMVGEPGFISALKRNIGRGSAFCIREQDGPPGKALLGGLLFSQKPPRYKISWLAVAERARRQGTGRALISHVLELVDQPAEIMVTSFGPENQEGNPARKFYQAMGFVPAEMAKPSPSGSPRQVFRKNIPALG